MFFPLADQVRIERDPVNETSAKMRRYREAFADECFQLCERIGEHTALLTSKAYAKWPCFFRSEGILEADVSTKSARTSDSELAEHITH